MDNTESYEKQTPSSQGQPQPQQMPPDATALLKADHDFVESLFAQCEQADGNAAKTAQFAPQIFQALEMHTKIEEEVVYPLASAQVYEPGEPMIEEFHEAHTAVKELISQLNTMDSNDSAFQSSFQDLMDSVRAHVEEEESALFPDLDGLPAEQLKQLATQIRQRKQELMSNIKQ
jgi:hemerythrin superfamily protein